ncbi:hypothetical protein MED15_00995 [Micromonospora noduli]|uniref:Uncharacterized protein n=1 Tax=Micromonospora noduli TaxID=709876 RepID=A0ABX9DC75_9ACTN|nr:hypothetical protein [Micromonospora noduli]RAO25232.1 hypothetical protein MED15_00995 [Micromonospora noduli]
MRFTLNGSPAAALAGQITDLTVQYGLVPARVESEHSRVSILYALLAVPVGVFVAARLAAVAAGTAAAGMVAGTFGYRRDLCA